MTTSPKEIKTKEEILHDHVDAHCFIKSNCYDAAIDAMMEFAQQRSIELINWLGKEDLKMYPEGWCQLGGSNGMHLSSTELYELFSHSIDK